MKISLLAIVLLVSLTGCIHTLATPEQIARADYGTLSPSYQRIIEESMYGVLFDPYSAHYRYFGEPVKGCAIVSVGGDPVFGYMVTVGINAKNRLGGYTGEDTYTFLVRNGTAWRLTYFTPKQLTP